MNDPRDPSALRVQAQQATLFALLKSGIPTAGAESAWRALTEATARTLAVRRASVWTLSPDAARLRLEDLYDLETQRHVNGAELAAKQYPAYFHALRWTRAIVAPDAASDPRTCEFAGEYLDRHGIVSMLDASIWQSGRARGVVCLESVGERRDWTADEQQFAGSMADLASSVLDNDQLRAARRKLEESEALFSIALRSSPDWMSVVRMADGVMLHVNEAFERESGHTAAELLGHSTLELGLWAQPERRTEWIGRVANEGLVRDHEVEFRMRSGEPRTFQLCGHRVAIHGEECIVTVGRDVTERRRQERLIQDIASGVGAQTGESFFRSLVAHMASVLGADLAFVGEVKPGDAGVVRTVAAHAGGRPAKDFEYPLDGSPCQTIVGHEVCAYPDRVAERFPRDKALAEQGIEAYVGAPLSAADGRALGLMAVLFRRPLTDPKLAENLLTIFAARASGEMERTQQLQSLEHQARHDPLTGLANRVLLREKVAAGLRALPGGGRGALLLVDLDRFKEINDTLGHHVGDALLIKLSRRLEAEMKAFHSGEVARLGGDEFAVWLGALDRDGAAEAVAARALSAITAPLEIEGYRLEVDASIGIALAPAHADSPAGLLRCADVAMYEAKRHGCGFAVYNAAQDPYSAQRLALLTELGTAVGRGEMELHYQPRLDLASGQPSGFEALLRWRHPRLGLLPPARFIPLAELSDVIRPLTLWVLATSLAQHREWGLPGRMAVNLSARHLLDDACPERFARILAEARVDPAALELEITESALIADPERAGATLERLRAMGVRIAIDDFGTGYSSLSHLKRLPLNTLKIDVSFVRQMLASPADATIVRSTIALAHELGLSVSAEGIEDEATLAALRSQGCDEGQGFHIGRPMPAPEAAHWIGAYPR
jgi:diguanylate cyclase (GGDEF)-like protein/PAS domain S-box-containing protein